MADLETGASFDAERMVEEIATGEEKKPKVNIDADYELSKEFAVAEIDKTEEGQAAAEKATESKFGQSEFKEVEIPVPASDSDPAAFLEMAKDVNPNL